MPAPGEHKTVQSRILAYAEAIVHELLHFSVPNHGKLWKMLMRAHLGNWEKLDRGLRVKPGDVHRHRRKR